MDDERARRLVEKLRAFDGETGERERLLRMLASCGDAADAAVRDAPGVGRDLARHRASGMTLAQLAKAIAGGADLDALPLDDGLYRYLAQREDEVGAAAIDRLCRREGGFELRWFEEHAGDRLRRHAIARAGRGDATWFAAAVRGGGGHGVERYLEGDDAEVRLEAARALALHGHLAAVALLARDEHSVWSLCATIEQARERHEDGEVLDVAMAALERVAAATPNDERELPALCRAAEVGCRTAIDPLVARIVDPRRFGKAFDDAAYRNAGRLFEKLISFARVVRPEPPEQARLVAAAQAALAYRAPRAVADAMTLAAILADPALVPTIVASYQRQDRHQHEAERVAACTAIGAPARLALEEALRGSRDPEVRAHVTVTLGALAHPATIPSLLVAVEDPEPPVRAAVLRCLTLVARPLTEDVLLAYVRAAEDPDPDVRVRAAQSLSGNRDPRAVDALRRSFATADTATKARLRNFVPRG